MKYFKVNNDTTLDDLKKQFRELAKIHHPDKGGKEESMREVLLEYDLCLKQFTKNGTQAEKDEVYQIVKDLIKEYTQKYQHLYGIYDLVTDGTFEKQLISSLDNFITEFISKAQEKGKNSDLGKIINNKLKSFMQ